MKNDEKNKLKQLFAEEEKVSKAIEQVAEVLIGMSEFVIAKSAMELAQVEVLGKRLQEICDSIKDEVHEAKKTLGSLMMDHTHAEFKGADKSLHDMEHVLALIHSDLSRLGDIGLKFPQSFHKEAAFENLNKAYRTLTENVRQLIVDESPIKKIIIH